MNHTESIESNCGNIKLVRLIFNDHYSQLWIEFNSLQDLEYPKQTLIWDNADFIFGKFYKFLNRWDNRKLKKKDEENFKDIWSILTDELVWEMLKMVEFAIEREWNQYKSK